MRAPLFLARRAYRQRRLTDAARFLPLLGAFLFLLPIFWQPGETSRPDTGFGGLYIFIVWGGLIALTALLSILIGRQATADEPPDADPGRGDEGRG